MNERIKQILDESGLTQEKFAQKIGLSRNGVQKIIYGKNGVSEGTIRLICTEFNVNRVWLETGKGYMNMPADEFENALKQIWPDVSPRVIEFMKRVNETPGGMERLIDALDSIAPFVTKKPEA